MRAIYLLIFVLLPLADSSSPDKSPEDKKQKIVSARLESCPGCTLNKLSDVKKFVYDDLPAYGVEFKKINGKQPELLFLNEADEVVEKHQLSRLSRDQCNKLLQSKGFKPKSNPEL